MAISNNSSSNSLPIKPSTPNVSGARVYRSLQDIGNLLRETSASERGETNKFDSFTPADPEVQKENALQHTKNISQQNRIKDGLLAKQANQSATAILLQAALLLDPTLSEFPKKGTEGKSPEEAQKILAKNIETLTKGPDNIKTLHTIAAKISEKLSGDKALKNSDEAESTPENQELLAKIKSAIEGGTHEGVQELLEDLKGTNPQLLSALKPLINDYKISLENSYKFEQRNIANKDEMKKNPLFQEGVEFKNDKALRNLFAKLAGQMIDQKGGIYNFKDDDVTWQLAPFEHKPGVDGRTVTDLTIRRLLPSELANNNTYTAHLTEEQPTYTTMQVA